jgi:hypothetical protein
MEAVPIAFIFEADGATAWPKSAVIAATPPMLANSASSTKAELRLRPMAKDIR